MQQPVVHAIKTAIASTAKYGAAAIAGAFAWSIVQANVTIKSVEEAPTYPIMLALNIERHLHQFEETHSPEAAVAAARSIDNLRTLVKDSGNLPYKDSPKAQAFFAELQSIDLSAVLGEPGPTCSAYPGACTLVYGSEKSPVPAGADVSALATDMSVRQLHQKAHTVTEEMVKAHMYRQPYSSGFGNHHPFVQAINDVAYDISSRAYTVMSF